MNDVSDGAFATNQSQEEPRWLGGLRQPIHMPPTPNLSQLPSAQSSLASRFQTEDSTDRSEGQDRADYEPPGVEAGTEGTNNRRREQNTSEAIQELRAPNKSVIPERFYRESQDSRLPPHPVGRIRPPAEKIVGMTGVSLGALNQIVPLLEARRAEARKSRLQESAHELRASRSGSPKSTSGPPRFVAERDFSRAEARGEDKRRVDLLKLADSVPARTDDHKPAKDFFFRDLSQNIFKQASEIHRSQKERTQKDDAVFGRQGETEEIAEIHITGDEDHRFFAKPAVNFFIRSIGKYVAAVLNFMARLTDRLSKGAWAVRINQEFHKGLLGLWGQLLFVGEKRGVEDTGLNFFIGQWSKFLFDLFKTQSRSEGFENNVHRRPRVTDTGPAALDSWPDRDIFPNQISIHPLSPFTRKVYHAAKELSSWTSLLFQAPTAALSPRSEVRPEKAFRIIHDTIELERLSVREAQQALRTP